MRLILREEVDHLGGRGDVVNVSRGYARNFLLPKRLAMEVNDDNLRLIKKAKKIYLVKVAKEKGDAEVLASRLSTVTLNFRRKVHGETEELYGSVTPSDIAEALAEKGEPIKSIGEFAATIKFHPEVSASFPVIVEKDETAEEAKDENRET